MNNLKDICNEAQNEYHRDVLKNNIELSSIKINDDDFINNIKQTGEKEYTFSEATTHEKCQAFKSFEYIYNQKHKHSIEIGETLPLQYKFQYTEMTGKHFFCKLFKSLMNK